MASAIETRAPSIDWRVEEVPIPYPEAVAFMEDQVAGIRAGEASEMVWLVTHPSCYTLGVRGRPEDILSNPHNIPVYESGRGGQLTYHGAGQRVVYVMVDLKTRHISAQAWIRFLEGWQLKTLEGLGLQAEADPQAIGIWLGTAQGRRKIASIGVRVRRGVSYHGFALNIDPDLSYFHAIQACGLQGTHMTSLAKVKKGLSFQEVDVMLRKVFVEMVETI